LSLSLSPVSVFFYFLRQTEGLSQREAFLAAAQALRLEQDRYAELARQRTDQLNQVREPFSRCSLAVCVSSGLFCCYSSASARAR
jgi:hypothetical protein